MTLLIDFRANTDKLASAIPIVDEIMAISGVPGLSIGIINQGKVVGTHHFGYRDIGATVRPNDQTRYNINSLTKGITMFPVTCKARRFAHVKY
jgi:CubicO group peptidase (beta-lactamase class C family)